MDWKELLASRSPAFWDLLGMRLSYADNRKVEIELLAEEKHLNLLGTVHGGVLSAVMDQAMGMLVAEARGGQFGVTTHLNVQFLAPMSKGTLTASAYLIHETYRTLTLRAEVKDDNGLLGCIATASFRVPKHTE